MGSYIGLLIALYDRCGEVLFRHITHAWVHSCLVGGLIDLNTAASFLCVVNVYKDWAKSRNEAFKDFQPDNRKFPTAPEDPSLLSVDEINYWLSKFCVDVRQKNGEEYRHEVLYSLFCALNRVIRESHRNLVLFKSPEVKPFQDVLDGRLKALQSIQNPFRNKADAVSVNEEEKLWITGALGTHSPGVLLDTLVFLAGKIFALRGGQEHRSLKADFQSSHEAPRSSLRVMHEHFHPITMLKS